MPGAAKPPSIPSDDEKKLGVEPGEFEPATVAVDGLPPDPDAGLSDEERAAILSFLYLISFLDRTNIGNAKIDGLQDDLGMTNGQYNASLSIFFISYSLAEPLTNVLLKRMRPSVFLPTIMFLWGISQMGGVGGKPGWAWIFILEGLATILVGGLSFWMVHDFPDDAKFLSPEDRARVIRRLKADKQSSAEHEEFKMDYFWASVMDWKTYAFAIIYMGCDGALYAFSLFLPTIINELGYASTTANLLSVPPYAVAAILTVAVGWLADRTRLRGYCNIGISFLGIIGFSMLLGSTSPAVKYAGTFLGAAGIYPCISNTISWASNNVEGVYKRGITIGFVIGWGNLNGVVSSNIYRQQDRPRYLVGHGVVLAYLVAFLLLGSIATHIALRRENSRRRRGDRDIWVEGKGDEEIELLGDMRPDFMYVL
ncbi:putative mfs transporter [Diplodia seriata]|nr:putative mfs transporter [Diplodia seriata]